MANVIVVLIIAALCAVAVKHIISDVKGGGCAGCSGCSSGRKSCSSCSSISAAELDRLAERMAKQRMERKAAEN